VKLRAKYGFRIKWGMTGRGTFVMNCGEENPLRCRGLTVEIATFAWGGLAMTGDGGRRLIREMDR